MKRFLYFLTALSFLFFTCSPSDENRQSNPNDLKAAIEETCSTRINFEDHENNVYAYRADALFAVPSVQAGGHSTVDESTDLGVNFFFSIPPATTGNYVISDEAGIIGSAYVYYIIGGVEYISTDNNTSVLEVEELILNEDGSVASLRCKFNEVEVRDNSDFINGDTLCVNAFELVVTN